MKLTFYMCKEVDYSKAPDVVAVSRRGVRLYMVRWKLHIQNFQPTRRGSGVRVLKPRERQGRCSWAVAG